MPKPEDPFSAVTAELETLLGNLRFELREALEAALPELDGARALGRALGLKRGLGWKTYAFVTSSTLPEALAVMPRRSGWNLILSSVRKAGCPDRKCRTLVEAAETALTRMEDGRIGRPMLRSIAAGRLDNHQQTSALLRARRSVREGFEAIFGIRCKAQVGMYIVGPAATDGWLDVVSVLQHEGLQRLHPGPPIGIKWLTQTGHPTRRDKIVGKPLGAITAQGSLVPELSTPGLWENHLRVQVGANGPVVSFNAGTDGTSRPVRTVFAEHLPRSGTVEGRDDRVNLHMAPVVPTALCVFEAWIHRSLRRKTEPAASL